MFLKHMKIANGKYIAATMFFLTFALMPVSASDWLPPGYGPTWQSPVNQARTGEISGRIESLQSAEGLLNAHINNNMGEKLGSVKELILDKNLDVVSYVVISSEGLSRAVPWAAFDTASASIKLNIDKSRFMEAPLISPEYTEQLSSREYREEISKFFSAQITAVTKARAGEKIKMDAAKMPDLRRYHEVAGIKVKNLQGEDIAGVRNLVFDTHQGRIMYCLVGFGGLFGIGEKVAAVPWSSLAIESSARVAYLDANRATLETAVVDQRNLEKLTQPQFTRNIHENFGSKPYWEVLGFVPPAEKGTSLSAWKAGSEYNNFFNPDTITIFEGNIRSVGIFTPQWYASPGLKLTVETLRGESVVVHCGPERYAMQRAIDFKPGSLITVTGSKTEIAGESVIMAVEIKVSGKTLLLRDSTGAPKWNVEIMSHEIESLHGSESEWERSQQWE